MFTYRILSLLLLLPSTAALAVSPVTLAENTRVFRNADCSSTGTCDLKSFSLKVKTYQLTGGKLGSSRFLGTEMFANFETTNHPALANYGVAQFIQGCVYRSVERANGEIFRKSLLIDTARGRVRYKFPTARIDGFTPDPLNWGEDSRGGRLGYYFNANPEFMNDEDAAYLFMRAPREPRLWLRDTVDVVHYDPESKTARNISLRFKTCIYRSSDVPLVVDRENLDFARPLACFDWQSSHVFNHRTRKYESPREIDPFCFEPEEENRDAR